MTSGRETFCLTVKPFRKYFSQFGKQGQNTLEGIHIPSGLWDQGVLQGVVGRADRLGPDKKQ